MKSKLRFLAALLSATMALQAAKLDFQSASAATSILISPYSTYEINNGVFEGWGTSLCWWANRLGYSDSLAQQAADAFFGDEGLRMNIARFNIGGGDDPTHKHITRTDSNMPGYTKYQNGQVTYDWSADFNQRNVLLRCIQNAGDDMIVEMFSNSPPYYMTQSGCSSGGKDPNKNNLRDDQYEAFAEYLAEVTAHYVKDWGVEIQSISPMNEPYTNFWSAYSYKQEGCHFDQGDSQTKILLALQSSMQRRGLGDVIISASDETSIDTQIGSYNKLSAAAKAAVSRIDTHTYGGSRRSDLKNLALSEGKNLWMSEVDGAGTAGTNAGEMGPALWLAERMTIDCNDLNASAWILWQAIDKHISKDGYNGNQDSGMPDISKGFWGLAVADHDNNKIILTKKYYAFGQYSRYIRPGMTMLKSSGSTLAAYDKENKQLVVVALNTSGGNKDVEFDLSGFGSIGSKAQVIRTSLTENWKNVGDLTTTGSGLQAALAPNSVTTFIIDDVTGGQALENKIAVTEDMLSGTAAWNQSSNDYKKVFDGNTTTYFDGLGDGWVMADLGQIYDFTAIGYAPRSSFEYRCPDGIFEVSNDGVNWTTIYTISAKPNSGMQYVTRLQGIPTGRYVRYRVPSGAPQNEYNKDNVYCCNIAEIELYGTPSLTAGYERIEVTNDMVSGSDPWNQSANDVYNAFDEDTATYFDGVSNGWAMVDLGAVYELSAIGYCPRKGHETRCVSAFFEVSEDGVNWEKIHTITKQPAFGMQYVTKFDQTPEARFIRYRVPASDASQTDNPYCCNIAEIELYGNFLREAEILGDVDGDGSVRIADAVMLCKYLTGSGKLTNWLAADFDGNEVITAIDLSYLKRLLLA